MLYEEGAAGVDGRAWPLAKFIGRWGLDGSEAETETSDLVPKRSSQPMLTKCVCTTVEDHDHQQHAYCHFGAHHHHHHHQPQAKTHHRLSTNPSRDFNAMHSVQQLLFKLLLGPTGPLVLITDPQLKEPCTAAPRPHLWAACFTFG